MRSSVFILICLLGGCVVASEQHQTQVLDDRLSQVVCRWSDKYSACFCFTHYYEPRNDGSFTYVPDRLCGVK